MGCRASKPEARAAVVEPEVQTAPAPEAVEPPREAWGASLEPAEEPAPAENGKGETDPESGLAKTSLEEVALAPGVETKDTAKEPLVAKEPPPAAATEPTGLEPSFCEAYCKKFKGAGVKGPPTPPWHYSGMSWVGSFCGIGALGIIQTWLLPVVGEHIYSALTLLLPADFKPDYSPLWIIIGSYGATAVLVYGQPQAPPSQPWNTLFGNTLGALVGMCVYQLAELVGLQQQIWLTGGLAVSLAIVGQEITQSQHPPGGATALLTALMPNLQNTHFIYVLCPGFLGPLVLVTVSMLVNNLSQVRAYPITWARPWTEPAAAATQEEPEPTTSLGKYLVKFRPKGGAVLSRPPLKETFFSWLGAFIGIATLGAIQPPVMRLTDLFTIIGSFGAVSVLVYSLPASPLSQPKNALLGDTIGAVVGVAVVKTFELAHRLFGSGHCFWLMGALAVSLTIVAQERTTSVFPPGGATSLIFVLRSCAAGLPEEHPFRIDDVWDWYVIVPGLFGPWVLVTVAMLTNNLSSKRSYPARWWDGA